MFRTICVPVDNSEHSNVAVDLALSLAKAAGGEIVGSHVFAARLHDVRFKQMEFTLPDKYREEPELERQRRVHDSLISNGLKLISDSYLDVLERKCAEASIPFSRKTFDGRNYKMLADDINENRYDLVVMGALGMGATRESLLGSVTERVLRRVRGSDFIVVKRDAVAADAPIAVALDGSPQSFAAFRTALDLARVFGRRVVALAVYDPYLHYNVFHGIADVLSEKAANVFRFKEQEQLHEEIIDTGLAKIYQSHLDVARRLAAEEGTPIDVRLLAGKAFEKVLEFVRNERPWLLALGRTGVHSGEDEIEMGSNAENLVRLAPCSVFLTARKFVPPVDLKAEAAMTWTPEAADRMERVPGFVRGVARNAIHRWAMDRGHSVITSGLIDEAIGELIPEPARRAMGMGGGPATASAEEGSPARAFVCGVCGYTARGAVPVKCSVCGAGSDRFRDMAAEVAKNSPEAEGGIREERTFDGITLAWTEEAIGLLGTVPAGHSRERAKGQVEKTARVRRLALITREVVEEIVGRAKGGGDAAGGSRAPAPERFDWSPDARARLERIPAGFMQEMIRKKIEVLAAERGASRITLELAEEAIAQGRKVMEETMAAVSHGVSGHVAPTGGAGS